MLKHHRILLTIAALSLLACTSPLVSHADSSNMPQEQFNRVASYDISQWQGKINNKQAQGLKSEVHFMILKAENGSYYKDPQFKHTATELRHNQIPYGAYDYSIYNGPNQAVNEADKLYARAPRANFYVNDCEVNDAGGQLDSATQAWADEMHQLTKKPIVLYSDLSFMNSLSSNTRSAYDALWVAAYGNEPNPPWHYDLWQYTDKHYSPALQQNVDASVIPYGGHDVTFWTGKHTNQHHIITVKPVGKGRHRPIIHIDYKIKERHEHHTRPKAMMINKGYYQSPNVRHLKVVDTKGICLYDMRGRYLMHIKRGRILHVDHFKKYPYTKYTYMTRAVDFWHHKWVQYTARKSKLYPYYFD